jgi:type II secretory pathway component GspD/PulD (secretin)
MHKIRKDFLMKQSGHTEGISFFIITLLISFCYAQQDADGTAKALPVLDESSPILTEMLNPKLKTPITLWAKDANLAEVLKVLAERSEMNFVAGESVHQGKITIILNKTPLDEAIDLLVRASGLSYEIVGNSVLIASPGNLEKEVGQSSYVVRLKYAEAKEVASMLSDITKNIKVDEGGNRLVCFTSPRVIYEIEKVVRSIDQPHILVLLETRLIEVSMDRLGQYGIEWGDLFPLSTGIKYQESPLTDGFAMSNWLQMELPINVTLDLLVSNGDARVLMDSKLTTTNNREASLHIGEIVPYTIQSYNLTSSGGANQQIQKEEVGVKILMTPHINDDNQITLTMEPEVSSIAGWKGPNADMPMVRVRKTRTTVRVEDNQTIFLAGLLSEETSEEIRKLPLLGDIPVIGLIFQHKKKITSKKNLIIEIKPRIVYNSRDLNFSGDIDLKEEKK